MDYRAKYKNHIAHRKLFRYGRINPWERNDKVDHFSVLKKALSKEWEEMTETEKKVF